MVGNSYIGITSGLPVTRAHRDNPRRDSKSSDPLGLKDRAGVLAKPDEPADRINQLHRVIANTVLKDDLDGFDVSNFG
jgi:hypothetical protein